MSDPRCPSLYQTNTRVWLNEISAHLDRPATLDDVPDAELDRIAAEGFRWVWFLGVWQTGRKAREAALADASLQAEYRRTLPDFSERDVCGSCFAVAGYTAHSALGGDAALARLRDRLHRRGLRLMVDFVPNHTGLDHPWVNEHPGFYVHGTDEDLAHNPHNYCRVETPEGKTVLAHGRDPYFAGWQDTLQLNYANPELQEAMISELLRIAERADGVRCDMAMLILPEVFEQTWGLRPRPFWPDAIGRVRESRPDFLFLAEVYWDLEWTLQRQGFDCTYDKRLYDRLRDGQARALRDHFRATLEFQRKSARFLENHDEPRAAAVFPPEMHRAAAVLAFLCPGLRFFHRGQIEGRRVRIPMQLCRGPEEPADSEIRDFYDHLLDCLRNPIVRDGDWELLECSPAWEGNWTWDCFIAFAWLGADGRRLLVAANYSPHQSQCYVRLPFEELRGRAVRLQDAMSPAAYDRAGDDLTGRGLYLDERPWGCHVFELSV
jgi:Alpha amylase, catalytic domain